jgi:hypothetical protein
MFKLVQIRLVRQYLTTACIQLVSVKSNNKIWKDFFCEKMLSWKISIYLKKLKDVAWFQNGDQWLILTYNQPWASAGIFPGGGRLLLAKKLCKEYKNISIKWQKVGRGHTRAINIFSTFLFSCFYMLIIDNEIDWNWGLGWSIFVN